jgi:Ca2+-binding RTX toxin-like protein
VSSVRTVLLSATTAALGLTGMLTATVPASALAPSCQGREATIVGPNSGRSTVGTPGDDVIVTTAEGFAGPGSITSGEGDDLVCIVAGTAPLPDPDIDSTFRVGAGDGNDTVVVEEPRNTSYLHVELGGGDDTFVGSVRPETVYAGLRPGSERLGADDGRDAIAAAGGEDHVYTGSPVPDSPNDDVVSTGDGQDTVVHGGVGTALDNGAGDGDNLSLVHPRWGQDHVTVDNREHLATADGGVFLRWTNVRFVNIQVDSPATFVGSDADEIVYASTTLPLEERAAAPFDAQMSGGHDSLVYIDGPLAGRVDGGPESDSLEVPLCSEVRYVLDSSFTCTRNGAAGPVVLTARVTGWEGRAVVRARQGATVVGSARGDAAVVNARRIRVFGRGGDDTLTVSPHAPRRASVVMVGGAGDDYLLGSATRDTLRGSAGRDILFGNSGRDVLLGGTGRDLARGGAGRDTCSAERPSACEVLRD